MWNRILLILAILGTLTTLVGQLYIQTCIKKEVKKIADDMVEYYKWDKEQVKKLYE